MSASKGWTGTRVEKARAYWTRRLIEADMAGEPLLCSFADKDPLCPGPVRYAHESWDVDHVIPRHMGGSVLSMHNQWPAHSACNSRAGAAMTNTIKKGKAKRLWSW